MGKYQSLWDRSKEELKCIQWQTLDFPSGQNLAVCEFFEPHIGSAVTVQSLLGIVSLSLSLSLCVSHSK